ncbi:MAG: Gfo/Idh/MocA family oxidoreductase [Bryobacteraceae bacterium]|nr:Gfo/Idh/MocA family oxidoreductase [Bryobacteraceae bacterium]
MNEPTRRALIGAATLVPASAVKSSAANSTPSVGVIGVGNRGSNLARLAAEQTSAKLTAICDLSDEKVAAAKKIAPSARTFKDYHELLKSDVDAVIIATPVFLHAEHLEAAVQAGKHIYIEKPAASSLADCKKMLRIVDSAPRRININFGFQRRYGQLYQKAKQAHDAGAIGRIQWAQVQFVKSVRARSGPAGRPASMEEKIRNWGAWQELSGDLIVENNIHLIDVMNLFMGARPLKAHGTGGRTNKGYGDNRDHVHVTYSYPDNVSGLLVGTGLAAPGFRYVFEQFHGPAGTIEVSENYWKLLRGLKEEAGERATRNPSVDSVAAFVGRVAQNKPENSGARGIESTLTAILGRMAMDRGREVTWDEMMASA